MTKAANKKEEITHSEVDGNQSNQNETESKTQNMNNKSNQKVVTHPKDVAAIVMAQMNNVNTKKDELTIAIKSLTDTTEQLVKAYAGNMQMIHDLAQRIENLEEK